MKFLKSLFRYKRPNQSWFKYLMSLLHLWLGLLSSLFIIVVCLTGAIYGLRKPLTDLTNRSLTHINQVNQTIMPIDTLVKPILKSGGELQSLFIPHSPKRAIYVAFTNNTGEAGSGYINPYNGKNLGNGSTMGSDFFATMLSLHKNLLLGNTGKQMVGLSVLVFVFMLISGLVMWWPRNFKGFLDGISVKWRFSPFRMLRDLHNSLGFNALILLLFISITGLYVAYPWMKNGIIVILGGQSITSTSTLSPGTEVSSSFADLMKEMMAKESEKQMSQTTPSLSIDTIMAITQKQLGYSGDIHIVFPNNENPRYTINQINNGNFLKIKFPDVVTLDRLGQIKSIDRFSDKPLHKQFVAMSLPLHTGEFFGITGIIIYVLASLIGCSLPITGFLLWWKKVR